MSVIIKIMLIEAFSVESNRVIRSSELKPTTTATPLLHKWHCLPSVDYIPMLCLNQECNDLNDFNRSIFSRKQRGPPQLKSESHHHLYSTSGTIHKAKGHSK